MTNFDELIKNKELMESPDGWKTVWTNVFALEHIYVAVKSPETEEEKVAPYFFIGMIGEDKTTIFAFTDVEHAEIFGKSLDETPDLTIPYEFKKLTIIEFVNMCNKLTLDGPDFVAFNHAQPYGFHTEVKSIVPMYNLSLGEADLQERKVAENTEIQIAIPEKLDEMKDALHFVKKNFKTVLNSVSPLLVRAENTINLTLVLEYKGGLPNELKKTVMKNLHNELSAFPAFQTQIYFTEEKALIPPNASPFVTVKF